MSHSIVSIQRHASWTMAVHSVHGPHAGVHPSITQSAGQTAASNAGEQEGTHANGSAAPAFEWESSGHPLKRADIERYSRQLILPALGVQGALWYSLFA
jgi:hypothetical protein